MAAQGYAIKVSLTDVVPEADGSGGTFKVSVVGGANAWGLQALTYRRSPLLNVYDAMVIDAYLRASSWTGSYDLELSPSTGSCDTTWSVRTA